MIIMDMGVNNEFNGEGFDLFHCFIGRLGVGIRGTRVDDDVPLPCIDVTTVDDVAVGGFIHDLGFTEKTVNIRGDTHRFESIIKCTQTRNG
jgi:hypothetical protein